MIISHLTTKFYNFLFDIMSSHEDCNLESDTECKINSPDFNKYKTQIALSSYKQQEIDVANQEKVQDALCSPESLLNSKFENLAVKSGLFGLHNFGNTCYINSILQVLLNNSKFMETLRYSNQTIAKYMVRLSKMSEKRERRRALKKFLTSTRKLDAKWADGEQRDAKEFFIFILSTLYSDLDSNLTSVFYGKKTSRYKFSCGHPTIKSSQRFGFLNGGQFIIKEYIRDILPSMICSSRRIEPIDYPCELCNTTVSCYERRVTKLPDFITLYFDNKVQQSIELKSLFLVEIGD